MIGRLKSVVVQRRRRASTRAMALPTPTDADYSSFALAATVTGALTFVVFRAIVYFRMQVRSLEFSRDGSELYAFCTCCYAGGSLLA